MGKPRKITKPHISNKPLSEHGLLVEKITKKMYLHSCNLLIITKKDYNTLKELYPEEEGCIKLPITYCRPFFNSPSNVIVERINSFFFVTPARNKNGK